MRRTSTEIALQSITELYNAAFWISLGGRHWQKREMPKGISLLFGLWTKRGREGGRQRERTKWHFTIRHNNYKQNKLKPYRQWSGRKIYLWQSGNILDPILRREADYWLLFFSVGLFRADPFRSDDNKWTQLLDLFACPSSEIFDSERPCSVHQRGISGHLCRRGNCLTKSNEASCHSCCWIIMLNIMWSGDNRYRVR